MPGSRGNIVNMNPVSVAKISSKRKEPASESVNSETSEILQSAAAHVQSEATNSDAADTVMTDIDADRNVSVFTIVSRSGTLSIEGNTSSSKLQSESVSSSFARTVASSSTIAPDSAARDSNADNGTSAIAAAHVIDHVGERDRKKSKTSSHALHEVANSTPVSSTLLQRFPSDHRTVTVASSDSAALGVHAIGNEKASAPIGDHDHAMIDLTDSDIDHHAIVGTSSSNSSCSSVPPPQAGPFRLNSNTGTSTVAACQTSTGRLSAVDSKSNVSSKKKVQAKPTAAATTSSSKLNTAAAASPKVEHVWNVKAEKPCTPKKVPPRIASLRKYALFDFLEAGAQSNDGESKKGQCRIRIVGFRTLQGSTTVLPYFNSCIEPIPNSFGVGTHPCSKIVTREAIEILESDSESEGDHDSDAYESKSQADEPGAASSSTAANLETNASTVTSTSNTSTRQSASSCEIGATQSAADRRTRDNPKPIKCTTQYYYQCKDGHQNNDWRERYLVRVCIEQVPCSEAVTNTLGLLKANVRAKETAVTNSETEFCSASGVKHRVDALYDATIMQDAAEVIFGCTAPQFAAMNSEKQEQLMKKVIDQRVPFYAEARISFSNIFGVQLDILSTIDYQASSDSIFGPSACASASSASSSSSSTHCGPSSTTVISAAAQPADASSMSCPTSVADNSARLNLGTQSADPQAGSDSVIGGTVSNKTDHNVNQSYDHDYDQAHRYHDGHSNHEPDVELHDHELYGGDQFQISAADYVYLPVPGDGNCAWYAIIVGLLCPVVENEVEFNQRLNRLIYPPATLNHQPSISKTNRIVEFPIPSPPRFESRNVIGEETFRSFLREYLRYVTVKPRLRPVANSDSDPDLYAWPGVCMTSTALPTGSGTGRSPPRLQLSRNINGPVFKLNRCDMWLRHGPQTMTNHLCIDPRCAAAIQYLTDLQLYLRRLVFYYRTTSEELSFRISEFTEKDIQEVSVDLGLTQSLRCSCRKRRTSTSSRSSNFSASISDLESVRRMTLQRLVKKHSCNQSFTSLDCIQVVASLFTAKIIIEWEAPTSSAPPITEIFLPKVGTCWERNPIVKLPSSLDIFLHFCRSNGNAADPEKNHFEARIHPACLQIDWARYTSPYINPETFLYNNHYHRVTSLNRLSTPINTDNVKTVTGDHAHDQLQQSHVLRSKSDLIMKPTQTAGLTTACAATETNFTMPLAGGTNVTIAASISLSSRRRRFTQEEKVRLVTLFTMNQISTRVEHIQNIHAVAVAFSKARETALPCSFQHIWKWCDNHQHSLRKISQDLVGLGQPDNINQIATEHSSPGTALARPFNLTSSGGAENRDLPESGPTINLRDLQLPVTVTRNSSISKGLPEDLRSSNTSSSTGAAITRSATHVAIGQVVENDAHVSCPVTSVNVNKMFHKSKSIDDALVHFWSETGIDRYVQFRHDFLNPTSKLSEPAVIEATHILRRELGPPVSNDDRRRCIHQYNQYMDPKLPILLCGCCGVQELPPVCFTQEEHRNAQSDQRRLIPLSELPTILQLNEEDIRQFESKSVVVQKAFSVTKVRLRHHYRDDLDHSAPPTLTADTASTVTVESIATAEYVYYHLHPNLVTYISSTSNEDNLRSKTYAYAALPSLRCSESAMGVPHVRLCSDCYARLFPTVGEPTIPKYCLASGFDYGHPEEMSLPSLSLLESQLIARYRIFSQIVKFVAPYPTASEAARQSAFTGHVIVLPHNGPHQCASQLPNTTDIDQVVVVMFIGTTEQWSSQYIRSTLLKRFRKIFEIRPAVVRRWLIALKEVGNPFYANITIPAAADETWNNMLEIPNSILNRANVLADDISYEMELSTASDIAKVRPHPTENPIPIPVPVPGPSISRSDSISVSPDINHVNGTHEPESHNHLNSEDYNPYDTLDSVFVCGSNEAISLHRDGCSPLVESDAAISSASATSQFFLQVNNAIGNAAVRAVNSNSEIRCQEGISKEITVDPTITAGAGGAVNASTAESNELQQEPILISISNTTLLNEYSENDHIFLGSFPHLFFLGRKFVTSSLPRMLREKLFQQYDCRFAQNEQVLFLAFNQLQRHTAAVKVAVQVRSNPRSLEQFSKLMNEPNIDTRLKAAAAAPESKEAKSLLKQILPLVRVSGGTIPFSSSERQQAMPKLYAYTRLFGLPSFFLTISPKDYDQPLAIRMILNPSNLSQWMKTCTASDSLNRDDHHRPDSDTSTSHSRDHHAPVTESDTVAPTGSGTDSTQRTFNFSLPTQNERAIMIARNPVAAATVFKRIMETVTKSLIDLPPFHLRCRSPIPPLHTRRNGVLGLVTAYFFVFEVQGRGTLHTHGVVWTNLSPLLLQDAAGYEPLTQILSEAINEICTASLPLHVYEEHAKRKKEGLTHIVGSLTACPEPNIIHVSSRETPEGVPQHVCTFGSQPDCPNKFNLHYQRIACEVNIHKHLKTCRKGNHGKFGCRMSMPQAPRTEPTGPVQLSRQLIEDHLSAADAPPVPHAYIQDQLQSDHADRKSQWLLVAEPVASRTRVTAASAEINCIRLSTATSTKLNAEPHLMSASQTSAADSESNSVTHCQAAAEPLRPATVILNQYNQPALSFPAIVKKDHLDLINDLNQAQSVSSVISWELNRPLEQDTKLVAFNSTITAAVACNTALYLLGSMFQAKSILMYLLKYMTKDSAALTNCLTAVAEARRTVQKYPSKAPNSGQPIRTGQHILTRLLNNLSCKQETSAAMAAAAILNMPSTFNSHDVWICFIWPAIKAVRITRHVKRNARRERHRIRTNTHSAKTVTVTSSSHCGDRKGSVKLFPNMSGVAALFAGSESESDSDDSESDSDPDFDPHVDSDSNSESSDSDSTPGSDSESAPGILNNRGEHLQSGSSNSTILHMQLLQQSESKSNVSEPTIGTAAVLMGGFNSESESTTTCTRRSGINTKSNTAPVTAAATVTTENMQSLVCPIMMIGANPSRDPKPDSIDGGPTAITKVAAHSANSNGEMDIIPNVRNQIIDNLQDFGDRILNDEDRHVSANTESFAPISHDSAGKVITMQQHEHYHYRGKRLAKLSFFEWVAIITVVRTKSRNVQESDSNSDFGSASEDSSSAESVSESESESEPELDPCNCPKSEASKTRKIGSHTKPRPSPWKENQIFRFSRLHPMYVTHRQQIRTNHIVPILSMPSPPLWPGENTKQSKRDQKLQKFARYMLLLLIPWQSDELTSPQAESDARRGTCTSTVTVPLSDSSNSRIHPRSDSVPETNTARLIDNQNSKFKAEPSQIELKKSRSDSFRISRINLRAKAREAYLKANPEFRSNAMIKVRLKFGHMDSQSFPSIDFNSMRFVHGPPMKLNYSNFHEVFSAYQHSNNIVLRTRYQFMRNLSHGFKVDHEAKILLTAFRNRAATRWNAQSVNSNGMYGYSAGCERPLGYDSDLEIDRSPDDDHDEGQALNNMIDQNLINKLRTEALLNDVDSNPWLVNQDLTVDKTALHNDNKLQRVYSNIVNSLFKQILTVPSNLIYRDSQPTGGAAALASSDATVNYHLMSSSESVRSSDLAAEIFHFYEPIYISNLFQELKSDEIDGEPELEVRVAESDVAVVDSNDLESDIDAHAAVTVPVPRLVPLCDPAPNRLSAACEARIRHQLEIEELNERQLLNESAVSMGSLNQRQQEALKCALEWIHHTEQYEEDPAHIAAPEPLFMLIHGGAGVGKSTFARALIQQAVHKDSMKSKIICAAPTGIAATLLTRGRTLHGLLNIRPFQRNERGSGNIRLESMLHCSTSKVIAQRRFSNKRILLIDEISMVGSVLFALVDQRLREIKCGPNGEPSPLPFGGIGIIVMGDFFQIPPVGDTFLPAAVLAVNARGSLSEPARSSGPTSVERAIKNVQSLSNEGGSLFKEFKMFSFTQQMRVNPDDITHTSLVAQFQTFTNNPCRDPAFVRHLKSKFLTSEDCTRDPSWMDATMIVPSNKQRRFLQLPRIQAFAKRRNEPIIRWHYSTFLTKQLDEQGLEYIYQQYPALIGIFVKGAPIYLTTNLNPSRGIANGTSAIQYSLSWKNKAYMEQVKAMYEVAKPGEIIDVEIPFAVNVHLSLSIGNSTSYSPPESAAAASALATAAGMSSNSEQIFSRTCPSLVEGKTVIPLRCNDKQTIRFKNGLTTKTFNQFPYEFAFVVTFHKCQGRTIEKAILDLNHLPGKSGSNTLNYSSLYVGMSRVRNGADIKLFPLLTEDSEDTFKHIKKFTPAKPLQEWLQGYNPHCTTSKWTPTPIPLQTGIGNQIWIGSKKSTSIRRTAQLISGTSRTRTTTDTVTVEGSQPATGHGKSSRRTRTRVRARSTTTTVTVPPESLDFTATSSIAHAGTILGQHDQSREHYIEQNLIQNAQLEDETKFKRRRTLSTSAAMTDRTGMIEPTDESSVEANTSRQPKSGTATLIIKLPRSTSIPRSKFSMKHSTITAGSHGRDQVEHESDAAAVRKRHGHPIVNPIRLKILKHDDGQWYADHCDTHHDSESTSSGAAKSDAACATARNGHDSEAAAESESDHESYESSDSDMPQVSDSELDTIFRNRRTDSESTLPSTAAAAAAASDSDQIDIVDEGLVSGHKKPSRRITISRYLRDDV